MPNKISLLAGKKLLERTYFKRGKTEVKVDHDGIATLHLHGNAIARQYPLKPCGLDITDAGYPTTTTQRRLNGVLELLPRPYRVISRGSDFFVESTAETNGIKPYPMPFNNWVCIYDVDVHYGQDPPKPKEKPKPQPPKVRNPYRDKDPYAGMSRKDAARQALQDAIGLSEESARELLKAFNFDLKEMMAATPETIARQGVKGIGYKTAQRISGAMQLAKEVTIQSVDRVKVTSPTDIAEIMMPILRYADQEHVYCLALDTKGQVKRKGVLTDEYNGNLVAEATPIFTGTLNASVFHPREIFRFAIDVMAASIVLVHNHPSGDPQPSQEDIRATKQLIEAGNTIGIKVLDHIVIGDGSFVSLKEEDFI